MDSEHTQGEDRTHPELRGRQCDDPQLCKVMDMLEQDLLPDDAAEARLLAMTGDQYVVHEGILYHQDTTPSSTNCRPEEAVLRGP